MRVQWIEEPSRSFSSLLLTSFAQVVVFVIALALPALALAQVPPGDVAISVFVGTTLPFKTDLRETSPPDDVTARNVELRASPSFGGKISFWTTNSRPNTGFDLGAELDITHFSPDVKRQSVTVTGTVSGVTDVEIDQDATIVAVNFLMRWPIGVTQQFPHGQWYPYWGVGVGTEVASAKPRETLLFIFTGGGRETDTAAVFQIPAGLKIFLSRNIALFAEYKFTRAEHTFDFPLTRVKLTNSVNHVVGGLAIHY